MKTILVVIALVGIAWKFWNKSMATETVPVALKDERDGCCCGLLHINCECAERCDDCGGLIIQKRVHEIID